VLCICDLQDHTLWYYNLTLLGVLFDRPKPNNDSYPEYIGTLVNPDFNDDIIRVNRDAILCRSETFFRTEDNEEGSPDEDDIQQLSAKLHCFKGMNSGHDAVSLYWNIAVPYARSKVYDLRNYTAKTRWGPFRRDGSLYVDWVMVEAIMLVISWNSMLLTTAPELVWQSNLFNTPWYRGDFHHSHNANMDGSLASDYPENRDFALDRLDPYGVTGRYRRVRTALKMC
jgi:hypothetical protein